MAEINIEKIVYLIRHGQSEGNTVPVFQSSDSPLNEEGEKQAEGIAVRVSRIDFESLIASPVERAKQTAEMIAKITGKKIEYSELFVERMRPMYTDGKLHTDEKASALWREWQKSLYTPNMKVEDGENFDELIARADKALSFLTNRKEKSLVVVTHGFFLKTIIARILFGDLISGETFRNFQRATSMENTGLTVLRYHSNDFEEKPDWRLWIYNDHAHLAD